MSKPARNPVSRFGSFLSRYSGEIRGVAGALAAIAGGIALPNNERERVNNAVNDLLNGADNIMRGIDAVKDIGAPSKEQVRDVVQAILPDLIAGLVEAELRKRLEATSPRD
jgi:hypothetical protein